MNRPPHLLLVEAPYYAHIAALLRQGAEHAVAAAGATCEAVSVPGAFGLISSTNNFNSNNDNAASPNTGTGLPRQIQFMVRVRF